MELLNKCEAEFSINEKDVDEKWDILFESIPGFQEDLLIRRYGLDSTEALWVAAKRGGDRALGVLYDRVKGMWRKVPKDKSGLHTYDDWVQIAAEEFVMVWHKFNPLRRCRFSTFIYTSIWYRWQNELSMQLVNRRKMNVDKVSIEDVLEMAFLQYNNSELVEVLFSRFHHYLQEHVEESVMVVYDACLVSDSLEPSVLSRVLGIGVDVVEQSLLVIRKALSSFGREENVVFS